MKFLAKENRMTLLTLSIQLPDNWTIWSISILFNLNRFGYENNKVAYLLSNHLIILNRWFKEHIQINFSKTKQTTSSDTEATFLYT